MDKRIITAVAVVVCVVVVYFSIQNITPGGGPGGGENQPEGLEKPTVEMPLAEVRAAIASREGVSQEHVEVYFCVHADTAENENFAAGAVVDNQKSIVFIYDNATGAISVKDEYSATTSDDLTAMGIVAQKRPTSRFTGNKVVPFDFVKDGATYSFNYYDGYDAYLGSWGFGTAIIDDAGAVPRENMTHTWAT